MTAAKKIEVTYDIPAKLKWVFEGKPRYRGAYGGRGSGKSIGFARMALLRSLERPIRFLGAREIQGTIRDSVLQELITQIEVLGLEDFFTYGEKFLRGTNGSEFIFKGLRHNYKEIKSTTGVDICWVEEAEAVSEASWQVLLPTIRQPGSEIWLTWNPEMEDSATHKRFILDPPEDARIAKLNWRDNPWFPPELEAERQKDMKADPDLYAHVWEGEPRNTTQSQILRGKVRIEQFEVPKRGWDGPYHGLDFGFANDPTAANKVWIAGNRLMIEREANRVGLELDDTPAFLEREIPGISRHVVRADSARPESISFLKRHGLPRIEGVRKYQGSVEDGITHLRSYDEIVVHPRCEETSRETRLYSYKVDRYTGDVLRQVVDAYNHHMDAIRYALQPLIEGRAIDYRKIL